MMSDVEIRFLNEGVDGLVAIGTYLSDAVKRFGIRFDEKCDHANGAHNCALVVSTGIDNLTDLTQAEAEHFSRHGRRPNERLACEAKIIRSGEIVIMTNTKQEETKEGAKAPTDNFQQEFDALPLDQKITRLLRMEAVTLSETVAYVVNSPMKVVEKVGDVMAEFGMKLEAEAKKATRPPEAAPASDGPKRRPAKSKGPKAQGASSPEADV